MPRPLAPRRGLSRWQPSLLAALLLATAGCTDDFNASTSCDVLAAKLDAPATLEPSAAAVFTLKFSSPVGTRYRLDWTATRGTLTPRDKVGAGAGGASGAGGISGVAGGSAGGQAGSSGTSGQTSAGDGGQAGTSAGLSGSSGQSSAGQSGSGAAGADDGAADPVSVADYVAPDAPGSVTITALLSRLSGSDSDGPAACPILADITVGNAGAGGEAGAAGAGGEAGAAGASGEAGAASVAGEAGAAGAGGEAGAAGAGGAAGA